MHAHAPSGPSVPRIELRLPASADGVAQGVRECEHFLQLHGVAPRACLRLALVLEEAVMNLAMHGHAAPGPHHALVTLSLHADTLELTLRDDGVAFDPLTATLPARPHTLDQARPGGLGVTLMRRFSRAMHYERVQDHNCLTIWLERL